MSRSPEAERHIAPGRAACVSWFVRRLFLLCAVWLFLCSTCALAQGNSQQSAAPSAAPQSEKQKAAPQSENKENAAELTSHDEPTMFKVNVKLVLVRAVVRDAHGHAVGNLHKEDFQVFDKGKPQVITQFDVEQPGELSAKAGQTSAENSGEAIPGEPPSNAVNVPAAPERFIAYLFDDVHLQFGDLAQVREAAQRHLATLRPTDRAAIFTTSGVSPLDFTDDRTKLHDALNGLQPRPIVGSFENQCPDISYYQADLIVNKNDPQALEVAIQETIACQTTELGVPPSSLSLASVTATVNAVSNQMLSVGQHESHVSLSALADVVNRISRAPGQRTIVLISPGFIAPNLEYEYIQIIDRAVRSQIIINALDARGLYVPMPFGDASHSSVGISAAGPAAIGVKGLIETAAISAQSDLLTVLADGTGGSFFHNSNGLDQGLRQVAGTPEYSYLLAFVPQNLKLDGSFHSLSVKLNSSLKLNVQARRGYYAPKNYAGPEEQAKEEIAEEMFSQEELHNLPVKLHTQFFKSGEDAAKLIVLAHVDVQHLRFRKAEGRNNNVLTCVSAVFNRNGSFILGAEKVVTMHWKDDTLEHKLASGLTLKTSFDVKPGSYLVRLVVRDEEAQAMSAENGTVEIR